MGNDIFEIIRTAVGTEYISDLRFGKYSREIKAFFKSEDITKYSLKELTDVAQYIFDGKTEFASYGEAKDFFKEKVSSGRWRLFDRKN